MTATGTIQKQRLGLPANIRKERLKKSESMSLREKLRWAKTMLERFMF